MPNELVERNARILKLYLTDVFTYDEIAAMQTPPISGARACQIVQRELKKRATNEKSPDN